MKKAFCVILIPFIMIFNIFTIMSKPITKEHEDFHDFNLIKAANFIVQLSTQNVFIQNTLQLACPDVLLEKYKTMPKEVFEELKNLEAPGYKDKTIGELVIEKKPILMYSLFQQLEQHHNPLQINYEKEKIHTKTCLPIEYKPNIYTSIIFGKEKNRCQKNRTNQNIEAMRRIHNKIKKEKIKLIEKIKQKQPVLENFTDYLFKDDSFNY